jgi:diguanylate cyclase (GGDEF)-like protein
VRQRSWWVFLALGIAVLCAYLAMPAGTARDVVYILIGLACGVAMVVGVRLHRPARPMAWYLMALGQFSSVAGDVVYNWLDHVLHVSPFPSVADVLYLSAYPTLGAGLVVLIRARQRYADLPGVIDSITVTVGGGLLSWLVLAQPVLNSGDPVLARLVGIAYPVGDLLLLGLLTRLVTAPGARTAAFRLLGCAVALVVVADTVFAVGSVGGLPSVGAAWDLSWLGSYLLWGAAALHPSVCELSRPGRESPAPFTVRRLAAVTVAVLMAPCALAVQLAFGLSVAGWSIAGASAALFLLVVVRMYLALREVVASTRRRDELQQELAHQVAYDSLTGLANRATMLGLIESALHRAQRSGSQLGLLALDLDRFKAVNDTFGHQAGDQVLREVATRMRNCVRAGDVLGRLAGDEFVVLVEPVSGPSELIELGERLLGVVAAPIAVGSRTVTVGMSVGVVLNADGSTDADAFLHHADAAAYRAKTAGRGRVEVFDDALRLQLDAQADLEHAIRTGLAAGEFLLHYQPVLRLRDGELLGYEALIRWQRPGHGLVLPDAFIPAAEESTLISDIGRWVLRQATSQLAEWRRADPGGHRNVTVAVNVSGRHLASPSIIGDVAAALRDSGLPATGLVVEVTETVLVDQLRCGPNLQALRELGVSVSIDDFGTGYTSIGQLQHLHVDRVKIDRSFISSPGPGATELVSLMINAAHAFGLEVVAEGIEDPDQLSALQELACDSGQGYLFAHPQPPSALSPRLESTGPGASGLARVR